MKTRCLSVGLALVIALVPNLAHADDPTSATETTPAPVPAAAFPAPAAPADPQTTTLTKTVVTPPEAPPKKPPPPYSLPWQLRPLNVGNVVRSDTSVASFRGKDMTTGESEAGNTVSSMLLAMYKVTPKLAPLARVAFVYNNEPFGPSGAVVVNPLFGALYATKQGHVKLAAFGAVTLPIGQGGGESPDPSAAKAASRGIPARSAMDNAMFATNYFAAIAGIGAGYVEHGFTAQAEATVLQLFNVRGPDTEDERRTNLTLGLHTGYFVAPQLSLGGELRYQQWLTDAAPVVKDPHARQTVTFAIGPRLHLKLDGKQWIRPGISYSRVLDQPWSNNSYQMIQIDVPYIF